MFADAHFAARGDLVEVDDPVAGPMRHQAPFPRFAGETPAAPSGAPRLGQHTREVLAEALGMSSEELDVLRSDGVI
jgi:succinyl-CoA---D-citramalate CoA-transferase